MQNGEEMRHYNDATGMKMIIRDYYEQTRATKLDNLEEIYNLPRLNREEIENLTTAFPL